MDTPAFAPCAVIGHPISHSVSPRLHQAFARQFSRPLDYQRLDATPEQFRDRVRAFFSGGGRGLNVTLPHKIAAFEMADVRHPRAQWAGAANTLWQHDGLLHADNSDGSGLLNDLARLHITLTAQHIAVLGAGGAAAGILPLLLKQNPHQITLINRSETRAQQLAGRFHDARVSALETSRRVAATVVISTVSDGFNDLIAQCDATAVNVVYDLNYGARANSTQQWARSQGCAWHDGLGMLIEQAAVSFEIWHGLKPDTTALHQGEF